jgi:hypothetical protein
MKAIAKTLKGVLAVVSFAGLVACEDIKIKNGEIPENHVGVVNELMGTYRGSFDGVPATIEIRMNGNKPEVRYRSQLGTDVLHPSCQSKIGDLSQIRVGTKDGQPVLYDAHFSFDAGQCWSSVRGRFLTLSFYKRKGRQHVDMSVLKEVRWEQRCSHYPTPRFPSADCRTEQVPVYIFGRFGR